MKNFTYQAADYSGVVSSGSIASETVEAARRDLGARGLYIISISEASGQLYLLKRRIFGSKVKRSDVLEFTSSFSIMLGSGVPIISCLDDIIASTANPDFKLILLSIRQNLQSGDPLSKSLEAQHDVFPDIIKTLVAVGEETGRLSESLGEAAEHLQRLENLSGAIKKALMYPIFAFIATIGALVFWMLFVIPSMTGTLKGMGVKLPALTVLLIDSSKLFQTHWKLMPVLFIGLPLAVSLAGRNRTFRYIRDRALLRTPLLEVVMFNKLLATFAEQFRMMLVAGIPIGRLFGLLVPALGNEFFGVHIMKAKDNILNGVPISESLEQQKILPPLVISKVRTGETSGTLDKQLDFLAKYYTRKLDDATENLGKIIEPVVMAVIGGMFALIIMGLLLPIYDLVSKVGKS